MSATILEGASRSPYRGAIVEEVPTGRVLFENNADEVSPPASMTKLMTFAVVYDKLQDGSLKLTSPVPVSASDAAMGGTQVWLKEGESFPVEEMIYAMMIQSANDAAHALARKATGGNTFEFVRMMNEKAQKLGMKHTIFKSPNGLPPASRKIANGDLTTPRDFATLCQYLLKNTNILKYTSVRERKFGVGIRKGDKVVYMLNHNHLLGKVDGVDGFKTGYTRGAGYCLSTTAKRDGKRIIVVTMGSPDWKTRDREITMLINKGFSRLALLPALPAKAVTAAPLVAKPVVTTKAATVMTLKAAAPAPAVTQSGKTMPAQ
jgi:D-alanyl-D-alanine carboxypeptidase (penicillin-binding protein 5/6)